jgi:hypothetical protein
MTTRSFEDTTFAYPQKEGEKPVVWFREFKVERFDAATPVRHEDLALTIPKGHQVQGDSDAAVAIQGADRLVGYRELPALWRKLQSLAKDEKK